MENDGSFNIGKSRGVLSCLPGKALVRHRQFNSYLTVRSHYVTVEDWPKSRYSAEYSAFNIVKLYAYPCRINSLGSDERKLLICKGSLVRITTITSNGLDLQPRRSRAGTLRRKARGSRGLR